jgi:hypothetical protein
MIKLTVATLLQKQQGGFFGTVLEISEINPAVWPPRTSKTAE